MYQWSDKAKGLGLRASIILRYATWGGAFEGAVGAAWGDVLAEAVGCVFFEVLLRLHFVPQVVDDAGEFETSDFYPVHYQAPEEIAVFAAPSFEKLIVAVHGKEVSAEIRHVASEHEVQVQI